MAEANPSWGYGHIHGELKGLGYKVSWQTVRRVMLDHGLLPDPDKPYKSTWNTFIRSHWDSICASDFFSVEAWGLKGLTRYMVFFVIEIATRKVEIVGIHTDPCETQMMQWARNLTDAQDGLLKDKRILIHDRDPARRRAGRSWDCRSGDRSRTRRSAPAATATPGPLLPPRR